MLYSCGRMVKTVMTAKINRFKLMYLSIMVA